MNRSRRATATPLRPRSGRGGVEWTGARRASGVPRAPWCMMGVCFECLVEIDGAAGRQACMIEVRDGMRIRRQPQVGDPGDDPGR